MTLKAFHITSPYVEAQAVLVYARTAAQARALGRSELDVDYVETLAERKPEHDVRAQTFTEPRIESDRAFLRGLGWACEDELCCASCGLYPMDLARFAVCRACEGCKECGCEDGCAQDEGFCGD